MKSGGAGWRGLSKDLCAIFVPLQSSLILSYLSSLGFAFGCAMRRSHLDHLCSWGPDATVDGKAHFVCGLICNHAMWVENNFVLV